MEAASASETSADFYQTTRRNNREDINVHIRRLENLKYFFVVYLTTLSVTQGVYHRTTV
jgi:hypothetical protein